MPLIGVGISQAVADGRYIRLAPSANQTGANPNISLAANGSLTITDHTATYDMLQVKDGTGLLSQNPAGLNWVFKDHLGNTVLSLTESTDAVNTKNNTLDDGSGNELAAGALTLFSGTALGAGQVFLKAGSGSATLMQTDAGGSVNHLAPAGHYVGLGQVDNSNKGIYVGGGTINMDVKLGTYDAVAIAGYGLSPIYAAGLLISLGTTSTAVASYTPTSATGQSFTVKWRLSAAAATTPTLTLTWTDPKAGAQSVTLSSVAMAANTTAQGVLPVVATSAAAISVTGSALVAGDIFATVEVIEDQ